MNNDELIAAGHELAKCLDNEPLLDIAKMIVGLADKLDVTNLALREKTKQCEQVAQAVGWVEGGNFTLAEAVSGHVSGLKAAAQRSEELAAENAALNNRMQKLIQIINNADNSYCMCGEAMETHAHGGCGHPTGMFDYHYNAWLEADTETPATDAFIAEQRAQGVGQLEYARRLKARIAELEARTVKLPSINPQMFNDDVMFGYRKAQREAVEFCAAAGINLETGGEA